MIAQQRHDRASRSSTFVESTLSQAEKTLTDHQHFRLRAEQWETLMTALDAPHRELPRLKQLLSEPSIFDTPNSR